MKTNMTEVLCYHKKPLSLFKSLLFKILLLWLNQPVQISFSLKWITLFYFIFLQVFTCTVSWIYQEEFREFSFLALPCWYVRYTDIFESNWLALRIMGRSEVFVLWWAESQGLSRTSESRTLIDATVFEPWSGNSQRMIAWQPFFTVYGDNRSWYGHMGSDMRTSPGKSDPSAGPVAVPKDACGDDLSERLQHGL